MERVVEAVGGTLVLLAGMLCIYIVAVGIVRFCSLPKEPCSVVLYQPKRRSMLFVWVMAFLACAGASAFFVAMGMGQTQTTVLSEVLRSIFPSSIDADHYLKIAQFGYGTGAGFQEQELMIVFFPLFPWIVRVVQWVTQLDYYLVGILIQPFFCATAVASLFWLTCRHFGKCIAWETLAFWAVLPGAFFFAMPMSESVFCAFLLLSFCALEIEQIPLFALCSFLATLSRPTGGLLLGVAGIAFLCALRRGAVRWRWLMAASAPAIGFAGYLWLNWHLYGNWWQYQIVQKEHWHQSLGSVFATLQYHTYYLFAWWVESPDFARYVSLFALAYILLELLLLAVVAKRLPLPWLGYSFVYVCVANAATWLLSAPRYALSMGFLPVCLVLACKNKWLKYVVFAVLLLISVQYLCAYLEWKPIY